MQSQSFGTKQANYVLLDETGRSQLNKIGCLGVLILVECMNLEAFLDDQVDESYAQSLSLIKTRFNVVLFSFLSDTQDVKQDYSGRRQCVIELG